MVLVRTFKAVVLWDWARNTWRKASSGLQYPSSRNAL